VETPLRPDYENFLDLSLSPFPISREGQLFNLLNIHYLNLNRLPALKLPVKHEKLQWMSLHHGLAFSDKERIAKENSTQQDRGSLINLKESIAAVFSGWAGVEKGSKNVKSRFHPLGLYSRTGGIGVYTLIFLNDIRLDLASHTIVADACVIPLSEQNLDKLSLALKRLTGIAHDLIRVVTPDDEIKLWKLLLPALAERCRTWKHLPTCEYLLQGIPTYMEGLEFEASPLCSCGKGKDLGTFGTRPEWKEFHSEATRIALSPLFSSSFIKTPTKKADVENANIGSSSLKSPVSKVSQSLSQCANCSGPGQPSLLSCSGCKQTKYCSRTCQKSHWKTHKLDCSKATS
jgi:MYND finger